MVCAANLLKMMNGSSLVNSIPDKVQDAYSLRCTPQVIGASRDALGFVLCQLGIEMNSATDNPLILMGLDDTELKNPENRAFSAGMFHGEPIGQAMDFLKIAISEVAALSERRLFRLTTGDLSQLLPPGLAGRNRPAVGMMVPQTTAAALVSENKALGWPASMDSIPTCEDQEDHIAMSTVAARRAEKVVQNSLRVIAIELLCAAHALEMRSEETPRLGLGVGTAQAISNIESILFEVKKDATIGDQIEAISAAILNGNLFLDLPQLQNVVPGVK
jgi:histidine ammonia-lyase